MTDILGEILKDTYTVGGLNQKLAALRQETANSAGLITSDIKAKSPRRALKTAFLKGGKLITPDIEALESKSESLPVVLITLAITLTKQEIIRLGQWFRQNVNPQALLEIHHDPKIIGGCKIIWQGVERDFSLRKKFKKK